MNNSINKFNATPSFQGNFISHISTKDAKRVENIQKLFKKSTADMPNDTLFLKHDKEYDYDFLHPNGNKFTIFSVAEGFDSWLDKYSDTEIAKKLSKVMRVLKEELRFEAKNSDFESEIESIANKKKAYTTKAKYLRDKGYDKMAQRYDTIADFNQSKIARIEAQKEANKEAFLKKVDKITDKDPLFNEYSTIFTE